jgi:UDP-3-O-[3-hydroxymyristoyl] N-acetylglucosamine deacetylase
MARLVLAGDRLRRMRGLNLKLQMQRTVQREVSCRGIGLHSGAKVSMKLRPAPPNFGVRFRRMDLGRHPAVVAHAHHVVNTLLATSIGSNGTTVSTIEHLMAAIYVSGIDNVLIELDGPEVPIFDGSAAPFLDILREAGLKDQSAQRQCMIITRPILLRDGDAFIKATPSQHFQVRYTIDFPHPLVGRQTLLWSFNESSFGREIARARTFGFLKDVQKLQSHGLAQGGSLANAVVFDEFGILNKDGFRYIDECVRHKILDFMGDLALAGKPMIGCFEVHKAGHALHTAFIKKLVSLPGHHSLSTPACVPATFFPFNAPPPVCGPNPTFN